MRALAALALVAAGCRCASASAVTYEDAYAFADRMGVDRTTVSCWESLEQVVCDGALAGRPVRIRCSADLTPACRWEEL